MKNANTGPATRAPRDERNLQWIGPKGVKPGYYVTEITFKGRRVRRFAGWTKEQARATLSKLRTAAFEGRIDDLLDPKREELRTFEGYAKEQIESETWKQKRSWDRDRGSFNRLRDYFGKKQIRAIADVTPAAVQAYINKRRNEDGAMPGTVNRELAFLRSILYLAVEDGLIETNPIRSRKGSARKWKLEENNSREEKVLKHLTTERVRRLVGVVDDSLRPILKVAVMTGMRQGEILGMAWQHVDLSTGTIRVPEENSKSKRERLIPADPMIVDELSRLSRAHERVFINPATSRPWIKWAFIEAFKRACAAAEIPYGRAEGITFHDLRHFAAFGLVKVTDIVTASRILGHATIQMTMRYVHPTEADKRLAVERMGEELFSPRQEDANEKNARATDARIN